RVGLVRGRGVGGVVEGAALGGRDGRHDVDRVAVAVGEVGRPVGEVVVRVQGEPVTGAVDRPGHVVGEVVGDGDCLGLARTVVLHGDREPDLVTGGERTRVGGLGDLDVGAVHRQLCPVAALFRRRVGLVR